MTLAFVVLLLGFHRLACSETISKTTLELRNHKPRVGGEAANR